MKLLIVDDHHLVREGLKPVLKRLGDSQETEVLEAASFEAAVESADRHPDLDLVVLDLNLRSSCARRSITARWASFRSPPART